MTRAQEKKFNRTETPAPFGKTNGSSKHKKRLAGQENTAVLSAWRLSILQSTQVFVTDANSEFRIPIKERGIEFKF